MNQYDLYKSRKSYFLEPQKLVSSVETFEQYKSMSKSITNPSILFNKKVNYWPAYTKQQEITQPLFVKTSNQSKINFKFLRDTDDHFATEKRLTLYDSNDNKSALLRAKEFVSQSHQVFSTSTSSPVKPHSSKQFDPTKRLHFSNQLQSKPSSANHNKIKLKITNVAIKHTTIDMSDQLSKIPEINDTNYIFGDKTKLISKLLEKNSQIETNSLDDRALSLVASAGSRPKKFSDTSSSKISLKDLNLDLEKNLKLVNSNTHLDETSECNFINNYTVSYPSLNSKFNTKLDRQFKRITPNSEKNRTKKEFTVSYTCTTRAKSSRTLPVDETVYINHFHPSKNPASISYEPMKSQRTTIPDKIQGVSVQIQKHKKYSNQNKDLASESVSLSNSGKMNNANDLNKNSFDTHYGATSLIEFT